MSDYIKKNTFFSKLGIILSAGLLLLGLNHAVAQDAACAKFKAQFPQYDMDNKGKPCDDGKGQWSKKSKAEVGAICSWDFGDRDCHLLVCVAYEPKSKPVRSNHAKREDFYRDDIVYKLSCNPK
jgi:hypothetical protein